MSFAKRVSQALRPMDMTMSCPPALTKLRTTALASSDMSRLRQVTGWPLTGSGSWPCSCSGITSESCPASAAVKPSAEKSVNGVTFSPKDWREAIVLGPSAEKSVESLSM
jgi:hypothetical protein